LAWYNKNNIRVEKKGAMMRDSNSNIKDSLANKMIPVELYGFVDDGFTKIQANPTPSFQTIELVARYLRKFLDICKKISVSLTEEQRKLHIAKLEEKYKKTVEANGNIDRELEISLEYADFVEHVLGLKEYADEERELLKDYKKFMSLCSH
jgi:hypothetical protein